MPAQLLRGHVAYRAHSTILGLRLRILRIGAAEIEQDDTRRAVLERLEERVPGLEIPVNDRNGVQSCARLRDEDERAHGADDRERAHEVQHLLERLPLQALHYD